MNDTWGFKKDDHNWKSTEQLLFNLVDCVSKGGNFLLNVGPTAEGLIPQPSLDRLREMGGYVRVSAEAIYGAGPSPFARLPYRVTTKPGKLYVHVFKSSFDSTVTLSGLQNRILRAYPLNDRTNPMSVVVRQRLPASVQSDLSMLDSSSPSLLLNVKPGKILTTICVEIEGEPIVVIPPLSPDKDGVLTLNAIDAKVHGGTARLQGRGDDSNIGYWTNKDDYLTWEFELPQGGKYDVALQQADGARVSISLTDAILEIALPATGGWDQFKSIAVGQFNVPKAGRYTLTVKPVELKNGVIMNLRRVVLRPVNSQ
jgi:alpha-L-fucosidase